MAPPDLTLKPRGHVGLCFSFNVCTVKGPADLQDDVGGAGVYIFIRVFELCGQGRVVGRPLAMVFPFPEVRGGRGAGKR